MDSNKGKGYTISVTLSDKVKNGLDAWVKEGVFFNRSEALRFLFQLGLAVTQKHDVRDQINASVAEASEIHPNEIAIIFATGFQSDIILSRQVLRAEGSPIYFASRRDLVRAMIEVGFTHFPTFADFAKYALQPSIKL